jgi:hypothetical protein
MVITAKKRNVILAGTNFNNRKSTIRRHCRKGMEAILKREPDNSFDSNAIAVFIAVPHLWGLLGQSLKQIGYIKATTAKALAKRMDAGLSIQARIINVYAPADTNYPKITLELDY